VQVTPPVTLEGYDVWVNMERAGGGSGTIITRVRL